MSQYPPSRIILLQRIPHGTFPSDQPPRYPRPNFLRILSLSSIDLLQNGRITVTQVSPPVTEPWTVESRLSSDWEPYRLEVQGVHSSCQSHLPPFLRSSLTFRPLFSVLYPRSTSRRLDRSHPRGQGGGWSNRDSFRGRGPGVKEDRCSSLYFLHGLTRVTHLGTSWGLNRVVQHLLPWFPVFST